MKETYGEWVLLPACPGEHRRIWLYEYEEWGAGAFVIEESHCPDSDLRLCTWQIRSGASFAGAQLAKGDCEIGVRYTKRIALEALIKLRANWTRP